MKIIDGVAHTEAAAKKDGTIHWVVENRCAHCGEPFVSISTAARYCSKAHRQAAYRERAKERNAQQRFVTARARN